MRKAIRPCPPVRAVLALPGSKSYTHRTLVAAALAAGESLLSNALKAEDTELTAPPWRKLGAGSIGRAPRIRVRASAANGGRSPSPFTWAIPAPPCASSRPWSPWDRGLTPSPARRASVSGPWANSCRPWHNWGCRLLRREVTAARRSPSRAASGAAGLWLSGTVSSQYVSALLFIGPLAPEGVEIEITDELVSRPYVDLTLGVMEDFGISYYREGYRFFRVPGGQDYQPADYAIEADASSASYFWAAAAITGGRVTIANLSGDSCQGDAAFPGVLEQMGCTLESEADGLTVQGGQLRGITADLAAMPDLVPTLAVVAACAQGETVITGVRPPAPQGVGPLSRGGHGTQKMGIAARDTADGLIIPGGTPHGAAIDTYQDHRLAMSFAVAGLKVPGIMHQRPRLRGQVLPGFLGVFRKVVSRQSVAAGFTVKIKIPLNPPLLKGDFKTPL